MPRYPEREARYEYRCDACGTTIPSFQGLYWFARERQQGDSTVEVPYCPECGAESIRPERR